MSNVYDSGLILYFILCVLTLGILVVIRAPYGRHDLGGWGPRMPSRAGWIVMESPAVLAALAFFLFYEPVGLMPWVLFGVWQLHYVHRAFVYPLLVRSERDMPVLVVGSGVAFNGFNAWMNMGWIAHYGGYNTGWMSDPRFVVGLGLFAVGFAINLQSDHVLRKLRKPGETGHKVPRGFLFEYVSSPNYLGEMMEWAGWAVMTWSLPGLAFALYTVANLGPRAMANHRWYADKFPDYPQSRKALIPFVL